MDYRQTRKRSWPLERRNSARQHLPQPSLGQLLVRASGPAFEPLSQFAELEFVHGLRLLHRDPEPSARADVRIEQASATELGDPSTAASYRVVAVTSTACEIPSGSVKETVQIRCCPTRIV
jgi:hypothetical protein